MPQVYTILLISCSSWPMPHHATSLSQVLYLLVCQRGNRIIHHTYEQQAAPKMRLMRRKYWLCLLIRPSSVTHTHTDLRQLWTTTTKIRFTEVDFYTVCILHAASILKTKTEADEILKSISAHRMYAHIARIHCLTLRCHLCLSSVSTVSLILLHVCWVRVPQASPALKIPAKERRAAPSSLLEESQQRL